MTELLEPIATPNIPFSISPEQIPRVEPPKKGNKNLFAIMFVSAFLIFGLTTLYTSYHVSQLQCTDLVYTTQNNGSVYGICDAVNIKNANNLIRYCSESPLDQEKKCWLPEGCDNRSIFTR